MTRNRSRQTHPNLAKLIAEDIITVGRLHLLLVIFLFASAMNVVFFTDHTIRAVNNNERVIAERDLLDNESRNLLVEKTVLAEHSRVEDLAKDVLGMKRPDPEEERIISLR